MLSYNSGLLPRGEDTPFAFVSGLVHRRRTGADADPFILRLYAALAEKERRLIFERPSDRPRGQEG